MSFGLKPNVIVAITNYNAQNMETNPNFEHFDNDNFQTQTDNITS